MTEDRAAACREGGIVKSGAGGPTRTGDLLITNQLLYQLSYAGLARTLGGRSADRANKIF